MAVCTLTFPENDPVIAGIGSPPFLIYRCLILDVGENRRDYLPRTAKCQPELSELHRDTAPVEMRSVTLSFYRQNPSSLTLRPRTNTRQADHSFELTHSMLGGRKPESVCRRPLADRARFPASASGFGRRPPVALCTCRGARWGRGGRGRSRRLREFLRETPSAGSKHSGSCPLRREEW